MNDKDKQELLIAISGYLPYGLKLDILVRDNPDIHSIDQVRYNNVGTYERLIKNEDSKFDIKPYLRPLSSMTDEEKKEIQDKHIVIAINTSGKVETDANGFDWLNAHHFDYRSLIDKGLALEEPENMY